MKNVKTKILISGSYGTGNVGDEIILACILDQLKQYDVTVLSQGEDYTVKNFPGIRVVPQTPSWDIIRIIKDLIKLRFSELGKRITFLRELSRADVFWLGGGGLLAEMVPAVLRFYNHQMKLASFLNCKVITFAVGVGPLRTPEGKRLLKDTIENKVQSISVRDEDSANLLREIGVKKNVKVIPDPAFLYLKQSPSNESYVVINFHPVFLDEQVWPGQQYRWQKLKDVLIEATRHIVEDLGHKVVYLPFGTKTDLKYANELKKEVSEKFTGLKDSLTVFEGKNYQEITDVLVAAKWSITMRFHAGLISMVNLKPSLCIDQQFKSERVLMGFGLSELLLSLPDGHHKKGNSDIEIDELKAKIKWLETNYDLCRSKLEVCVEKNQKDLRSFYSGLNSFLGI